MKRFDVLVIGSGGGTKLSTPASFLGLKSAIIEKGKWGGTCLNRGCIPSKMLIHPANVITHTKHANRLGLRTSYNGVDFAKLTHRINRETDKDSSGIPKWYDSKTKVKYFEGHGKFVSNNVVEVNGERVTAKRIFIAVGARPRIPGIPGLEGTPFMTSSEALRNRKLPKKLLVIGGGYIASELGHAYGAYGSSVHLIVRGDELLKLEDKDVRAEFTSRFSKEYTVHFGWSTQRVEYSKGMFTLTLKNKKGKVKRISGDGLLVATGVVPNTDTLGLENTSIALRKGGFVKVNKYMETSVKGVYALGDCAGNYMFRHSVNFEGEFLFKSLYVDKKRRAITYPPMPHAVFSFPEVAGVGKTEDELISSGVDYVVGMNSYKSSAQGMARLPDHGFVKLLFAVKSRRLIGAHIIGDEASTMIHQLIYAMTFKAKAEDLLKIIYIHPALPEIVRNAARKAMDKF